MRGMERWLDHHRLDDLNSFLEALLTRLVERSPVDGNASHLSSKAIQNNICDGKDMFDLIPKAGGISRWLQLY